MLTETETLVVADALMRYPAGVSSIYWGHGPMDKATGKSPGDFDLATLKRHG